MMNGQHFQNQTGGSKVSGFLNEPLAREIVERITGPRLKRTFAGAVRWFPAINRAHLVMLAEQGLIEDAVAGALLVEIDRLETEGPGAFTLDPEREDPWFNYETELTRRAGPDAGRLHMGRSRNDLKTTQDRLSARELAMELFSGCIGLRRALFDKARAECETTMPGYTHLQHAQPMTFGWYLLGIEAALARDAGRIWSALERMDQCPLGAGAFAGTRLPIRRERTAELLGFTAAQPHSLDAVANPDAIVELTCAVMQLSMTIGRMCQDFYLWSTFEFDMIAFPDRVASTSSIMPQKKNLTILENFKGRPAVLLGALNTAVASLKGTPFGHSQEISIETNRWIWDALHEMATMLPVASIIVDTAMPRRERMRTLAAANFATATSIADLLTLRYDVPFRDAHHIVGRYVRLVTEGADYREALRAAALQELSQIPDGIDDIIDEAINPEKALAALSVGPSRSESGRLIAEGEVRLADEKEQFAALRKRLEAASAMLKTTCDLLKQGSNQETRR
ncbi:argininosuccinate lyase [Rhizobium nepotum]|uniref:argininosuccinate lyase n=1 Tax=Rhizobium nepotum TaxID=1035271 RepID=UPI0006961B67|nr:argininosuccinate lyase [Rhizobium nepotum]